MSEELKSPERIWLEPACSGERCWCQSKLDDCDEDGCGEKAVEYVRADLAQPVADEVARLKAALEWYGEQSRLARITHSEGDAGRHALQADGGNRARAALADGGPHD